MAGTAVASLGLAGCVSTGFSESGARVSDVTVLSLHSDPVDVDVEIDKNGATVLDETYSLAGDRETQPTPSRLLDEPWMRDPGHFEFTIDASTIETTVEREVPSSGAGCYAVVIRVLPEGRVDVPVDSESAGCQ